MKHALLIILIAFAATSVARANGLGGQRLEKVIGSQIVDIGTDQKSAPQAGLPIQFDFNLLKSDSRDNIPYTDVVVFITENGKTMLDTDIAMAQSGPTLLTYNFSEGGNYNMEVSIYDKTKTLADASFPLTIEGAAATDPNSKALYIAGAVLIGIIAGFWGGNLMGRRRGA